MTFFNWVLVIGGVGFAIVLIAMYFWFMYQSIKAREWPYVALYVFMGLLTVGVVGTLVEAIYF